MIYLGIDNGKDGAVVVLGPDGKITEKYKTPLLKASTKGGKKQGRDEYDIVAMGALGYHLMHGAWSFFQTLGLRPVLDRPLKVITLGLTGIVVLGNISMPIAVMAGLIGKGY